MCTPKEKGGLGIMDLETQNKCLLSKWLFKLINEEGIWQPLLRNKYLAIKTITQVEKKPWDSQFWSGLMKVKNDFLRWVSFKVHNGEQVRLWDDVWLGHTSFRERFPRLYNLVRRKHDTMQQVISSVPLNVSFRRNLIGRNLDDWQELVYLTSNVQITDSPDRCIWSLHKSGQFSVHSMYAALMDEISLPINKPL